ncbi:MAG: XdhC family protein [Candidatus Cloacimonetes bacterium]|nr:XdhC family protein [Candidatus Cloacimonadota bacterium]
MDIIEKIYQLKQDKKSFVIATVIEAEGSTPGKTGFKMIITSGNETFGTVGGGTIEKMVEKDALKFLKRGMSGTKEYDLHLEENTSKEATGMMCGGAVKVYFESHLPKRKVFIFGGGHVSQALERILPREKYSIVIIDNREQFVSKSLHPFAEEHICKNYESYLEDFKPEIGSYAVIVTHGHKFDYDVLKMILIRNSGLKYIGMIGSKIKVKATLDKIKNVLGEVSLENLYSPIGIDLGGSSASEIALSIAAEMQALEYEKEVPHMRLR